ncbi:unnamed protein product [Ambrosiozyma monospora]|uniref:Unnamed protein product n=1 Tax=Ambrosiozyma monospora TaxID=43982 RepID=A0A9W6YT54_AMBMO|nr:unnamed protein product [Ambrosiozyma monospora]
MDIDSIEWRVLPILSHANFNRGIKKIKSVVMQDTSLTGFVGFNVEKLNRLNINNNRFLERIESTVKEVDGELVIAANSKGLKVILSDLEYAEKVVIKDADEVDIGNLENVKQNAEFINNKFTQLDVPHLKEVGASLSISKNANLERADFSSLTDVGGGLIVIDNMELNKIDCFPSLKTIGGAIEFRGDIEESSMQQLRLVKGSAIVKSSSSSFDCKNWIENQVSDVVRGGKIECGSGNSKTTEVFLVDDNGDITKGAAGVNEMKDQGKESGPEEIETKTSESSGHKLLSRFSTKGTYGIVIPSFAWGFITCLSFW